jgi:nucleotide-binding universal stress UspA family protein
VVGAYGSKDATIDDVPYMMGVLKAIKVKMKKILALPFMKGVKAVHNVEIGGVHHRILEAARKYKADMIIMGTHGASGFQEVFIGSNAEKIVRNSEIPIISVKKEIIEPKIEKISYASDFSEETELVFPEIEKIAGAFNAKIEIVKVITLLKFETSSKTQKNIQPFKDKFKGKNYTTSVYYDWNKQAGIRHFSDNINADMIALGTHGRQGLSHFFNGSIAENLVNHSSLPVLTVNILSNGSLKI